MRTASIAGLDTPGIAGTTTRLLDRTLGALATLCLVAMIAIVGAGVAARYLFNASLSWSDEVAVWLFLFIIFLGLPLSITRNVTLSFGGLAGRLQGRPAQLLRLLIDTIVGYVLILLMVGGSTVVQLVGGVTPALALPMWVPYAVLAGSAGAALLALVARPAVDGRAAWEPLVAVAVAVTWWLVFHRLDLLLLPEARPSLVAFSTFLATLVLGVPVAFAMLAGVFGGYLVGAPIAEAGIVQQLVTGASKYLLLAIPFFLAAGALMNAGGLTTRIIDFAATLVGHLRGGLGQVSVATATMFSGISGSSISEAAIASKLLAPDMIRHGYPAPVACATIAASSILPNIIPPSIALLLLAASVNLSVGDLWIAGVLPGVVLAASLMTTVHLLARWRGYGGQARRASLARMGRTGLGAAPILLLIAIILGGIRFGVVTPTEAGVLAVLYALFLGLVVYRSFGPRRLFASLGEAAVETATVGLLIGAAGPFAFLFIAEGVPQAIVAAIGGIVDGRLVMLLLVNVALLLFGMILDIGVGILVLTPMLMPLALQYGVDPIHFGIIVAVNLMLGGLTPPVGMLVYVTSSVTGTPADQTFRAMLPLLAGMLCGLLIITAWPWLSLALIR